MTFPDDSDRRARRAASRDRLAASPNPRSNRNGSSAAAEVPDNDADRDAQGSRDTATVAAEDSRIANELADSVIHALFGTGLRLHSLVPRATEAVRRELISTIADIDKSIWDIRNVIFALDPAASGWAAGDGAEGDPRRLTSAEQYRGRGAQDATAGDRATAARDRRLAAEDRRRAAQYLAEAYRDDVTGALSRRPGRERLQAEIDRAHRASTPLTVLFFDVDGLKQVNDRQGHRRGDELLAATGTALRTSLRSYDIVVRYGGDEFVCGLPGEGKHTAGETIARVQRALAGLVPAAQISAGQAQLLDGDTLDDLIERADVDLGLRRARRLQLLQRAEEPRATV